MNNRLKCYFKRIDFSTNSIPGLWAQKTHIVTYSQKKRTKNWIHFQLFSQFALLYVWFFVAITQTSFQCCCCFCTWQLTCSPFLNYIHSDQHGMLSIRLANKQQNSNVKARKNERNKTKQWTHLCVTGHDFKLSQFHTHASEHT